MIPDLFAQNPNWLLCNIGSRCLYRSMKRTFLKILLVILSSDIGLQIPIEALLPFFLKNWADKRVFPLIRETTGLECFIYDMLE